MLGILLVGVICLPFAKVPLPALPEFNVFYVAGVIFGDVATATLLYAQFGASGRSPLLVLGSAYLFTATLVIPHLLYFSELSPQTGWFAEAPQTAAYLWHAWHLAFPFAALAYAAMVRIEGPRPLRHRTRSIWLAVGSVLSAAVLVVLLVTAFESRLPELHNGRTWNPITFQLGWVMGIATVAALCATLSLRKRRDALNLWLSVALAAFLVDIVLNMFALQRFAFGWYAGRVSGLLAASFLFVMLLRETGSLYIALANAMDRLSRVNRDLEKRVAERTETLEIANAELTRLAEEREFLAYNDTLTGIPNRARFLQSLDAAVQKAAESRTIAGLILIDLDRFKAVNDAEGHLAGDDLLRKVAQRLRSVVRPSDTPARIGGDEFAIVAPDRSSRREVDALAAELHQSLSRTEDKLALRTTVSMGVAVTPDDARDAETLMHDADLALFEAKQRGRQQVCFFEPAMAEAARHRAEIEAELRQAIAQEDLLLYYQPQIELISGATRAVEALLRWSRPNDGFAAPSEFIPIAESSGLIRPLGQWALLEGCRRQAIWQKRGFDVKIAINVSPVQATAEEFPAQLDQVLEETGLAGDALELEITEGMLMEHDSLGVRRFLDVCRDRAIGLAIDDFGTGYSSLGYLKRLPISKVKIDRTFVNGIGRNGGDALIETLVEVGHRLGKRVVAEGVETRIQLQRLWDIGCDDVQGFHFTPPVDEVAIEAHL